METPMAAIKYGQERDLVGEVAVWWNVGSVGGFTFVVSLFRTSIRAILVTFLLTLPAITGTRGRLLGFRRPLVSTNAVARSSTPHAFAFINGGIDGGVLRLARIEAAYKYADSCIGNSIVGPNSAYRMRVAFAPGHCPNAVGAKTFLCLGRIRNRPIIGLTLANEILPKTSV